MAGYETAEDRAFRESLRAWLRANLPAGWLDGPVAPLPADQVERERLEHWWQRRLCEGGWAGPHWPRSAGGLELSLVRQRIYQEEMARHQAPRPLGFLGLSLVAPTLVQHGRPDQKDRHLRAILSGDEIWCIGFSEPNAGSDLAALQTRAVEDGDDYVVTGQKIWTSNAHLSQWCFLLARTDPQAPKHRGISVLLVDMASPGITVRPLRQITGESHFNEVYFDSVRVPKSRLLGPPNRGWYITVDLLSYERQFVGDTTDLRQKLAGLVRIAKSTRRDGATAHADPRVRARLADLAIAIEQVAQLGEIAFGAQLNGRPPGQEASMVKIIKTEAAQQMAALATDLLGPYAPLWRGSPRAVEGGRWSYEYLWSRAGSIYSGTNEILRTTIADRGLGLPR